MESNTNSNTDIFEEVATDLYFGQAAANIQSDFVKFSITGANDCKFYPLTGGNTNTYQNPNASTTVDFTSENHIMPHVKGSFKQKRDNNLISTLDVDLYAIGDICDIMDNTKVIKRISRVHETAYSATRRWNWEIQKQGLNIIGWATVSFDDLADKPKTNTADVPGSFLTDRFMIISENELTGGGKNAMSFTVSSDSMKVGVSILNILDPANPNDVSPVIGYLSGNPRRIRFVFEMAEPKYIPVTHSFLVEEGDTFVFEEEIYKETNYVINNIAPTTYSITAPSTIGSLIHRDSLNHTVAAATNIVRQIQPNFDQIVFSAAVPGNEDCSGVIQKEIDELAFSGGGTLVLRQGTYTLHNTILLREKVKLTSQHKSVIKKITIDDTPSDAILMQQTSWVDNLDFELENQDYAAIRIGMKNQDNRLGFYITNCDFYTGAKVEKPLSQETVNVPVSPSSGTSSGGTSYGESGGSGSGSSDNSGGETGGNSGGETSGTVSKTFYIYQPYHATGIRISLSKMQYTVIENVFGSNLKFWNLQYAIYANITPAQPGEKLPDGKRTGYIASLMFNKIYIDNCRTGVYCRANDCTLSEYVIQTQAGCEYGIYGICNAKNGSIYDLNDGKNIYQNYKHPMVGMYLTGDFNNKAEPYYAGNQGKYGVIDDGIFRAERYNEFGWMDYIPNEAYPSLRQSDEKEKSFPWYKFYGNHDNQLAFFTKKGGKIKSNINSSERFSNYPIENAFDPTLPAIDGNGKFLLHLRTPTTDKPVVDPYVIELDLKYNDTIPEEGEICSLVGFQTEQPCRYVKILAAGPKVKEKQSSLEDAHWTFESRIEEPDGTVIPADSDKSVWLQLYSSEDNLNNTVVAPFKANNELRFRYLRFEFSDCKYIDELKRFGIIHFFLFRHDRLPELFLPVGGGKLYGGLDLNGLFLNKLKNVQVPATAEALDGLPVLDENGTVLTNGTQRIPKEAAFCLSDNDPLHASSYLMQYFDSVTDQVAQEFHGTLDALFMHAKRTGQITRTPAGGTTVNCSFTWGPWTEQNSVKVLEEKKVDKVDGKGLSTNDYTNAEKSKLNLITFGNTSEISIGVNASSEYSGIAVGNNASATMGSAAIGYNASSSGSGCAAGYGANSSDGGAVGAYAKASYGGAVGSYAVTDNGFAGGCDAKTINNNGTPIDAIQLGSGTNHLMNTLQVYNHQLMDDMGFIPLERLGAIYWQEIIRSTSGTFTIAPNKDTYFTNPLTSATIDFTTKTPDASGNWPTCIYHFFFEVASTSSSIILPSGIRWENGIAPTFTTGVTYELTVVFIHNFNTNTDNDIYFGKVTKYLANN